VLLVGSVRAYEKLREPAQVRIGNEAVSGEKVVAVGTMEALRLARGTGDWGGKMVVRAVCVSGRSSEVAGELGVPVYGAWLEKETGAWVGLCVPNPLMEVGHESEQQGQREGSAGRLLPGWACVMGEEGAIVSGWHPGDVREISLPGLVLDEDGFFMPMEGGKNTLPLS
jgi:hypothetical protein